MEIEKIHYNRKEYREEYLRSPEWRLKRESILKRDPICTLCDEQSSMDVHHLIYDRLYHEYDTDVIGICRQCHNLVHRHPQLSECRDFLRLKTKFLFLKSGKKFPKRKKRIFKRPGWKMFRYGQPRKNFAKL